MTFKETLLRMTFTYPEIKNRMKNTDANKAYSLDDIPA